MFFVIIFKAMCILVAITAVAGFIVLANDLIHDEIFRFIIKEIMNKRHKSKKDAGNNSKLK